jgi:LacI family transcriptional regulator
MAARSAVGILVNLAQEYGRQVASGVVRRLHAAQMVYHIGEPDLQTLAAITRRCRALIVQVWNRPLLDAVRATGLPAVSVGDLPEDDRDLPCVHVDDAAVARLAAAHLHEAGMVATAFLGNGRFAFSARRANAFLKAAPAPVVEVDLAHLANDGDGWLPAEALAQLTSLRRPAGVFCASDGYARRLVDALVDANLRVPEDIAVLGVDNDPLVCNWSRVSLSSVPLPSEAIGEQAAELLVQRLAGSTVRGGIHLHAPLPPVTRGSTDLVAIADPMLRQALGWMREHLAEQVGIDQLLCALGGRIARRTLESRFQKMLGRTPHRELTRIRVTLAKRLLSDTDLPIAVIAKRCGFSSSSHFGTVLRANERVAPQQYRRQPTFLGFPA